TDAGWSNCTGETQRLAFSCGPQTMRSIVEAAAAGWARMRVRVRIPPRFLVWTTDRICRWKKEKCNDCFENKSDARDGDVAGAGFGRGRRHDLGEHRQRNAQRARGPRRWRGHDL